ncbi:hypothetical protein ACFYQA_17230 [Streptomyces sp. NPDC005774]|uniref:hypothetical protein n=1 Tax=Streptomyces sp. NPDC005774 TaxID=3364728 RepID=UPI00369E0B7E
MTALPEPRALRPVETGLGVLVHPTADRRLAVEHWLASAHKAPERAQQEWRTTGMTLLPMGTLLSAVRLPASLVVTMAGGRAPSKHTDAFLDEVLEGPVICDPRHEQYYALVPASMPATWHQAAEEWSANDDVECLGRGFYLGVPRVDRLEPGHDIHASYWSVSMPSAGTLCAPLSVARLIAAARAVSEEAPE